MLENVGNAITRLPMTDWDETWVVASNQRLYRKTFSSVLVVMLTAQWTLWFYGVYRSKTSTILIKFWWICATVLQKNKIW